MADKNLSAMTVIELRKLAKELHVPLSAGISKQGIIDRLTQAMGGEAAQAPAADVTVAPDAAPAEADADDEEAADDKSESENEDDADETDEEESSSPARPAAPAQPEFRQAYVAPRFNTRPAYQAPAFNSRQAAPRTPTPVEAPRTQTTRPVGFTPRFGPAAQEPSAPREEERISRPEQPRQPYQAAARPAYGEAPRFQQRPTYEQRPAYEQRPTYEQRPAYEQRPTYEQRPAYEQRPTYEQRSTYEQRPTSEPRPIADSRPVNAPGANPAVSEMLSAGECLDGTGVLELHPDGYGFLRSESLLPSAKDIYVSMAQVRRFGLRTGDRIAGKTRPLRDGDKYSAMLYITEVNGNPADGQPGRPAFDELTPVYPHRRIKLAEPDATRDDMRLVDLLTPIGFGQRALVQGPAECGRRKLMQHLAEAITANHPDAEVMLLLFSETPEDVTLLRDQVQCPVLASTFDMPPEHHLRLADLTLETALRRVEMGRDVVLLVDNLTTLTKVCTTAALQQGRQALGAVSPTSLIKAKRIFGAARCLREGGSLTVIAAMNAEAGSKVDEAIISEFRAAANMELTLDPAVAAQGVYPPLSLPHCATRRPEGVASLAQVDGLKVIRSMLDGLDPAAAVRELISMLKKTGANDELLARVPEWAAAMR